ncbi:MAG TPA: PAS domain S-box protein, partial [Solirubrobacteraceae bacterium]|nr:PAS domain S-box protein [Solirubrobacteraceae bacterium]
MIRSCASCASSSRRSPCSRLTGKTFTAQSSAGRAITEREGRLQALIDSSPLALVEFGLDTRIRLWNPAAERIFGWTREEMLGRGGLPMAPPHRREESEELFARVLAGDWINDYETERLRKDGTLVPVSIAAAPVRDGSGRIVGNMVAYTDITERKAQDAE